MALRSVLRKMPALGLSSPPMGPLMGPLRALSPAGSRLMSHAAPGGQTVQPRGTLAQQLESQQAEYERKWAELHRKGSEDERIATEKFDKAMEMIRQEAASGEAYYCEVERRCNEDISRLMKNVYIVGKTCTVLNIAFPAAALLVLMLTM